MCNACEAYQEAHVSQTCPTHELRSEEDDALEEREMHSRLCDELDIQYLDARSEGQ